jgi:hypothetical protein
MGTGAMGKASPKARGAVVTVALAAGFLLAACGSDEDSPPPPETVASLPAPTANRLAVRSERIADQLDSGDVCGAAHSADELDGAVASADVPAEIRTELEAATEQLVNTVNCPPPPEPKKPKKEKDDEGEEHGNDGDFGDGPPGQDGELPPGLEKQLEEMRDQYEDAELQP